MRGRCETWASGNRFNHSLFAWALSILVLIVLPFDWEFVHVNNEPEKPRSISLLLFRKLLKTLILFELSGLPPIFSEFFEKSLKSPIRSQGRECIPENSDLNGDVVFVPKEPNAPCEAHCVHLPEIRFDAYGHLDQTLGDRYRDVHVLVSYESEVGLGWSQDDIFEQGDLTWRPWSLRHLGVERKPVVFLCLRNEDIGMTSSGDGLAGDGGGAGGVLSGEGWVGGGVMGELNDCGGWGSCEILCSEDTSTCSFCLHLMFLVFSEVGSWEALGVLGSRDKVSGPSSNDCNDEFGGEGSEKVLCWVSVWAVGFCGGLVWFMELESWLSLGQGRGEIFRFAGDRKRSFNVDSKGIFEGKMRVWSSHELKRKERRESEEKVEGLRRKD
ncbi:uncharacterized protein G2W53_043811 [Senna tora]|uniref:Uncharacterized protein n=1 Tax=Senna tora TaxID=362788 RepID=A0A834SHU4_9FABA|nr:uncharacterized protein G2W53_043811 [Senna tora]